MMALSHRVGKRRNSKVRFDWLFGLVLQKNPSSHAMQQKKWKKGPKLIFFATLHKQSQINKSTHFKKR